MAANAPGCGTTGNGRTACSGGLTPTGTGRSRPRSSGSWPRCGGSPAGRPPRRRRVARAPEKAPRGSPISCRPRIRSRSSRRRSVRSSSSSATNVIRPRRRRSRAVCLLDTREGTRRGGEQGPAVVPGDLEASLLLRAVRYEDENIRMPPKHRLAADVVAVLEQWVRSGRPTRGTARPSLRSDVDIEEGRQFWAFQPPKAVSQPAVRDPAWPQSDVDRFLLAAMEAKGCGRWAMPIGPPCSGGSTST